MFREDIKRYIYEACRGHHWYVKRMETDQDHIHILLQYNPADSITGIVTALKQYSTHKAWQHYSGLLKKHYWEKRALWSGGYFAASVGQVSQKAIERYIASQG